MNNKVKRILLIVMMIAVFVYTVINYMNGGISTFSAVLFMVLMVWILVSQVGALIREWREE